MNRNRTKQRIQVYLECEKCDASDLTVGQVEHEAGWNGSMGGFRIVPLDDKGWWLHGDKEWSDSKSWLPPTIGLCPRCHAQIDATANK